jgi:hypothetical protein
MWFNFALTLWLGISTQVTCMVQPSMVFGPHVNEFVCYVETNTGDRWGAAGRFAPLKDNEVMPGPSPNFNDGKPAMPPKDETGQEL